MIDHLSSADLWRRIGDTRQVSRVERLVFDEGPTRGERLIRVATGGGVEFEIFPDRCLDIGQLSVDGTPVAWTAAGPGPARPAAQTDEAWRQSFRGGLMVTCGLDTFGGSSQDDGRQFALHGRASSLIATEVNTHAPDVASGDTEILISGVMHQVTLLGEHLRLRRVIRSALGARDLSVHDEVTNLSGTSTSHIILYHCNLGYPLLDEGTTVDIPGDNVTARDVASTEALTRWRSVPGPGTGVGEQVLRHGLPTGSPVTASVTHRTGLGVTMDVDPGQLPQIFQWRMFNDSGYVLGLEPASRGRIEGRAASRERDDLIMLAPGDTRRYDLRFSFTGRM